MATSRSPSWACGRSLRETECCAGPRTRISASSAPLSLAAPLPGVPGPSNISYLGRETFRASREPFEKETAPKFLFYAPRARTFQFHTRPDLQTANLNLSARATDKNNQTHWQRALVTSLLAPTSSTLIQRDLRLVRWKNWRPRQPPNRWKYSSRV